MSERETKLSVNGMSCASCVRHVREALAKVEGVRDVEVRLEEGEARVVHDPDAAPAARLIEAVDRAGYAASTQSP